MNECVNEQITNEDTVSTLGADFTCPGWESLCALPLPTPGSVVRLSPVAFSLLSLSGGVVRPQSGSLYRSRNGCSRSRHHICAPHGPEGKSPSPLIHP